MKLAYSQPCWSIAWIVVIGLFLTGVAHSGSIETDGMKTITGSVSYRERMLLPPNAEISVFLEDVARMDAPADVIAATRHTARGGPPWSFTLEYDPAKLHDKGRYALRARIEVDDRLMFTNTEHIPAFDRDPGTSVIIMVARTGVNRGGRDTPSRYPDASLTNTYWKLVELNSRSASIGAGQKELHMVLATEGNRTRGFSGCNSFTGDYELSDGQLQFGLVGVNYEGVYGWYGAGTALSGGAGKRETVHHQRRKPDSIQR